MALTPQKRAAAVLAFLAFAVIVAATLSPTAPARVEQRVLCITCGDYATLDFLLNVLLFAPFGAALTVAGMAPRRALVLCLLLSLSIELLQFRVVTGRDTSIADLLANVAGGAVGIGLARARRTIVWPTPAEARRLAVRAAFVWLGLIALTAWLVRPWRPSGLLNGQYVPVDPLESGFDGTLLRARLSGDSIPVYAIPESHPVARALRRDSVALRVALVPGGPTPEPIAIVGVGSPGRGKIFGLAQDANDALFRMRLNAEAAKLRAPSLRLVGALRPTTAGGDTLATDIRAGVTRRELFLRTAAARDSAALVLPLTVGLGWTMFVPWVLRLTSVPLLANALWMALLILPLGYWGAASAWRARAPLLAGVVLAVGLGLLAPAVGAHASPVPEWLGALGGLAAGAGLERLARRGRPPTA